MTHPQSPKSHAILIYLGSEKQSGPVRCSLIVDGCMQFERLIPRQGSSIPAKDLKLALEQILLRVEGIPGTLEFMDGLLYNGFSQVPMQILAISPEELAAFHGALKRN